MTASDSPQDGNADDNSTQVSLTITKIIVHKHLKLFFNLLSYLFLHLNYEIRVWQRCDTRESYEKHLFTTIIII